MPLAIPRYLIESFLEKFIPEAMEVMELMSVNAEGDGLTPKLRQILTNLKISNWATLYVDPLNALKIKLLVVMTPEEINAFNAEFSLMTPEEQEASLSEIIEDALLDEDKDVDESEEHVRQVFAAMSDAEKSELIRKAQHVWSFALPTMYNYFAMMAHRKTIFQLVKEAMEGDDESFLKTIQVDKTCLTTIPYFVERNRRAADEGEFNFQRQINTYRNRPIFQSRLRYPALWMVFAALDELNVLEDFERDKERFLTFCERIGVYGSKHEAADLDSFSKLLREYKKDQQRLAPFPVQKLVVKDVTPPK